MKHTNRIDLVIMTTNETTKKKNNKLNPVATIWSPGGLAQSGKTNTPNNGKTNTTATYCRKCHAPRGSSRKVRGETTAESSAQFVLNDEE